MAAEFEQGLAGLADVEDADYVGICGEGGEEVGVVWGGGEAEEWRRVGHCLLSFGGGHAAGGWGAWTEELVGVRKGREDTDLCLSRR